MEVISLQSGSGGNCVYVEADGVKLLFDAGISGKQAAERLAKHGRDIREVDALIISHDHRDHVWGMGVFHRKFGLPIYVTEATLASTLRRTQVGRLTDVRYFRAGRSLQFGRVRVETVPTPHDAADGVAFVIDDEACRFGLLTDLGHVFDGLDDVIASLDAVLIESNYDVRMLDLGPYPSFLKDRIRGPRGHLSNDDAAELLQRHGRELRWACLAHLSEENNDPSTALATHRKIVGDGLPLACADRRWTSSVMRV